MTLINNDTPNKTLRLYTFESKPLNRDYCTLELHCDRNKYTSQLLQSLLDLIKPKHLISIKMIYKDHDIDLIVHFKPSKRPCNYALYTSRRLKAIYSYSSIFKYNANIQLFNI